MKLSKKLTSILCAVALLVSALPAASAVSTEPLSEYAGQTIPVQVVEDTGDGLTSRIIYVAIPEDATETEKNALIYTTVTGKAPSSARTLSTRSDAVDSLYLSYANVNINYMPTQIAEGTTTMDIDELYVHMRFTPLANLSGLQLQVRNSYNDTSNWNGNVEFQDTPDAYYEVVFYRSDFAIRANTDISVWAKVPSGILKLNYCYMAGLKR